MIFNKISLYKIFKKLSLVMIFTIFSFLLIVSNISAQESSSTSSTPLLIAPAPTNLSSSTSSISSSNTSTDLKNGIIVKNSNGKNFSMKITPGIQDIFSLNVPIQLDIESFIDADRFELSQVISPDPDSVKLSIQNNYLGSLKVGDKKSYTIYIEPKKSGFTNIYLTGQAWQNNLTLTDVAYITINFDKNLQVTPQSDDFKNNIKTWENIKTFVNVVIVVVTLLIIFVLVRKFAKWWKRD